MGTVQILYIKQWRNKYRYCTEVETDQTMHIAQRLYAKHIAMLTQRNSGDAVRHIMKC